MNHQNTFSSTQQSLFSVIRTQSDIARPGLSIDKIIELATERCMILSEADGAVIELAEGEDMVYRATSGLAAPQLFANRTSGQSCRSVCRNRPDTEIR